MANTGGHDSDIGLTAFAIGSFLVAIFTIAYQMVCAWMDKRNEIAHTKSRQAENEWHDQTLTIQTLLETIKSLLNLIQNNTGESINLRRAIEAQTEAIAALTKSLDNRIVVLQEIRQVQEHIETAIRFMEDHTADIPEIKQRLEIVVRTLDNLTAETVPNLNQEV